MRIGLLSDSHGEFDPAIWDYLAECDEVWHAGDFGSYDALLRLKEAKPVVRAVYGNIDGAQVRAEIPEELQWECEGLRVYMTHIGGYPGNYDRRAETQLRARRPDLFVCGHSHILRVMRDPALGLMYLNPGACGHYGWHQVRTLIRFTVKAGSLSAAEAVELGPRGRGIRLTKR